MSVCILVLTLLIFAAKDSKGRSIDTEEDNSLEGSTFDPRQSLLGKDWIKFTKAPPIKIVQQLGSPVEITCEVMGSQVPTIQWVEGRKSLFDIDELDSNIISESSSSALVRVRSIHIVDRQLNEPQAYTCVGRTGSKTVFASTLVYPAQDRKNIVEVADKFLLSPRKPKIIYNEIVHLDLVGSNIVLPCKVHARPHAEVYWMNGDGQLIEQNHRYRLLPSGDLLISDIKWEDMGAYRCIARNFVGKDSADTFIYPVLKDEK